MERINNIIAKMSNLETIIKYYCHHDKVHEDQDIVDLETFTCQMALFAGCFPCEYFHPAHTVEVRRERIQKSLDRIDLLFQVVDRATMLEVDSHYAKLLPKVFEMLNVIKVAISTEIPPVYEN